MNPSFVDSVYSNWARMGLEQQMAPDATFFAITVDERDAWGQLGFEVSGGWCTRSV